MGYNVIWNKPCEGRGCNGKKMIGSRFIHTPACMITG